MLILLIERFSNPALKHQTWQIATDGSQKIPQRMGGSLRFHLENGSDYKWLTMGIAGWMRYVGGVDEQGNAIDIRDPLAETFAAINVKHQDSAAKVKALLSIETIFDKALLENAAFVKQLIDAYQLVTIKGARYAVASL